MERKIMAKPLILDQTFVHLQYKIIDIKIKNTDSKNVKILKKPSSSKSSFANFKNVLLV